MVSNFIVQTLNGKNITIYDDGQQTRSFCYVDDMIEGFIRMMDSEQDFTDPVNMGNPRKFTMLELAEKMLRLVGRKSKLSFHALPTNDPQTTPAGYLFGQVQAGLETKSLSGGWAEGNYYLFLRIIGAIGTNV